MTEWEPLGRILEKQGCRVYEAANGLEAIRVLEQLDLGASDRVILIQKPFSMRELTYQVRLLQARRPLEATSDA